jgi:hypothetical protein
MVDKRPSIIELTRLVADLEDGHAGTLVRERAVALALHLYAVDVISRMKCLGVVRAAGSTTPTLDAAVGIVENEWRGGDHRTGQSRRFRCAWLGRSGPVQDRADDR